MWPWQIPGKANSWGSQKDYANRDAMNTGIATATGDLANPGLQLRQHCREVWGLRNESEGGCSIKTTALKAQETNETGLQPLRLGPQVERCRWGKKKKKKNEARLQGCKSWGMKEATGADGEGMERGSQTHLLTSLHAVGDQ